MSKRSVSMIKIVGVDEYPYWCDGKVHRYKGNYTIFEKCNHRCKKEQRTRRSDHNG